MCLSLESKISIKNSETYFMNKKIIVIFLIVAVSLAFITKCGVDKHRANKADEITITIKRR